jgi:tetratricopeptide (TPR) repeat protein
MQASTPITKQTVGKTFHIAVWVLGATALIQIVVIVNAFVKQSASRSVRDDAAEEARPFLAPGEEPGNLDIEDTPLAVKDNALTLATRGAQPAPPVAALPRPTPVPITEQRMTREARILDAAEQARALRERGDNATALVRLREAATLAPNDPQIIAETALTFEKMGLDNKALEQWRRIYDMGEKAGIYHTAAEAKLRQADAPAAPKTAAARQEVPGLQTGSALGILDVATEDRTDATVAKKLALRVPIKARSGAVNVHDVVIQVFFYDVLSDASVVQTNANVSYQWKTVPADWSDDDIEILEASYSQPLDPDPAKQRTYYGHVVRVYYKGELQDWRAEPAKLRQQFPPPLTLETTTEQK